MMYYFFLKINNILFISLILSKILNNIKKENKLFLNIYLLENK